MPKISETLRLATQSADLTADIPVHAYVTWGTIVEQIAGAAEKQILDGVPGLLWRGSLTDVITGLWPDLAEETETRRTINAYLRQTENMLCLKRNRLPLWWVRKDWNQIDITLPRGFKPVSKGCRAACDKLTQPPQAPVISQWQCQTGGCDYRASDPNEFSAHMASHVYLDESSRLATENEALRSEIAKMRKMLAGIRVAIAA